MTRPDPNTASLDALRDELARLTGWGLLAHSDAFIMDRVWQHPNGSTSTSPCPNTIDGLAKVWPEGWRFSVDNLGFDNNDEGRWRACGCPDTDDGPDHYIYSHAPTEFEARLRLTVAVLQHKEDGK